ERHQRKERRELGIDRAVERLDDRVVDDILERLAAMASHILTDAVEDDDRIVDRKADNGEESRQEQRVYLPPKETAGQRRQPENYQDVVYHRQDCRGPIPEWVGNVPEGEGKVEENPD